ncbi:MAG: adenosine deaminase, partial [Acidobacteriota bacterium]|nr:adenosine deaminase [Acidobacteriota bacterium]
MSEEPLSSRFISLPKAELHVHLEGSVRPVTACEIAAEHGINVTAEEVALRYGYRNFAEFIEAFK